MAAAEKHMHTPMPKNHKDLMTSRMRSAFLAQKYGEEALGVQVEIMRDKDAPVYARLQASTNILNRAYGYPTQEVLTQGEDDRKKPVLDVSQLPKETLIYLHKAMKPAND